MMRHNLMCAYLHSQSKNNLNSMIHLRRDCDNFTLHATFVFLAKVCNLKLLFSPKHVEDVLIFSQLEINGRKLNVRRGNGRGRICFI